MKIFFLGGTSYLGREIIKRLEISGDHEISVLVRSLVSAEKLKGMKVRCLFENDLDQLPVQDVVFNLVVDYGKNKSLFDVMEANVQFPLHVLEMINFKTIINFSTALEKNVSHYSFSKKVLEESLSHLQMENNWQVVNLHLQHFFGPGAPDHNFVTFLIDKLLNNEDLALTDCQQKRDFIFAPDLLDAIEIILEKLSSLDSNLNLELGSGIALKLQDFVEKIKHLAGSRSSINYGAVPRRPNEPAELKANVEFIERLGWTMKNSLEDALKVTIADRQIKWN